MARVVYSRHTSTSAAALTSRHRARGFDIASLTKSSLLAAMAQGALQTQLTSNIPPAEVVTIHSEVLV